MCDSHCEPCAETYKFTYDASEIIDSNHRLVIPSVVNPTSGDTSNTISQSYANLYMDRNPNPVGKIFYFDRKDRIDPLNYYISDIVVLLDNYPGLEPTTYALGTVFYAISNILFDGDKTYNVHAITTGGSFSETNVKFKIITDRTSIRKLILRESF